MHPSTCFTLNRVSEQTNVMREPQKTVVIYAFNAVGHIHATLAIADRLKQDHGFRTIYLVVGPTIEAIQDHGHELVVVEDVEPLIIDPGDPTMTAQIKRCGFSLKDSKLDHDGKVKISGHAKWPITSANLQDAFRGDPTDGLKQLADQMIRRQVVREFVANHEAVDRALEVIKPDLILIDHLMAPIWALENEPKVPWVRLRSANPLIVLKSTLPGQERPGAFLGLPLYDKAERARLRTEEPNRWIQILDEWRRTDGLVKTSLGEAVKEMKELLKAKDCRWSDSEFETNSKFLNIYLMPEALDYAHEDDIFRYPPRWVRCDSLVRQPTGKLDSMEIRRWSKKLELAMQNKSEMIYFSLGSIASSNVELMKRYIEMLWDDDKRLYVIVKGCNGDSLELNPTNMIGANYLPQTFFLQRAKLAIIHGGNNGLTESMYYGVPMIVLPMFGDQLDNAQRVQDVGLGLRLNLYNCTKVELLGAIDRLCDDDTLGLKIREIGKQMQNRDDLAKISKLIKKLIGGERLDDIELS